MIGVDQITAILLVGAVKQLLQHRKLVEHRMLRIEFDGEAQFVFGGDVAGALEIFDRVLDRALERARRAHQHGAAERDRVLAGFPEHAEQPLAFVAGGE